MINTKEEKIIVIGTFVLFEKGKKKINWKKGKKKAEKFVQNEFVKAFANMIEEAYK